MHPTHILMAALSVPAQDDPHDVLDYLTPNLPPGVRLLGIHAASVTDRTARTTHAYTHYLEVDHEPAAHRPDRPDH